MSKLNFFVTDRNSVPLFSDKNITHIISIGHQEDFPALGLLKNNSFTLYRFVFNDISHEEMGGPNKRHIERLIRIYDSLSKETEDVNILFHCAAGISRSTAAAFIMLVYFGLSYSDAYKEVTKARGCFINPNELMCKYADELLSKNGQLYNFIKAKHDSFCL